MTKMTMKDIATRMGKIDHADFLTKTTGQRLASRPMSNNKQVEYDGDSFYFGRDSSRMYADLQTDRNVVLTMQSAGGEDADALMLTIQGKAELIDDQTEFEAHWHGDLDAYFENGVDTDGLILVKVKADRITWWMGRDQGEIEP